MILIVALYFFLKFNKNNKATTICNFHKEVPIDMLIKLITEKQTTLTKVDLLYI
jgi:hypothetical protein